MSTQSTQHDSIQTASQEAGGERIAGIFTRRGLLSTVILSALLIWLFNQWFIFQLKVSWANKEDWGHTLVIPFISAYLLWQSRDAIARTPVRIFWPAVVPLLMGILAYANNLFFISNPMLQGFSMVLCVGSLVLFCTGPAMLRHAFLPILYLVLMVTIAESIMLSVTFSLQLLASQGSWLMLSLIGEPFQWFTVDLVGNRLDIMTSSGELHPLNVAEACSGMRMVVAFYALAGAVALLGCTQWWQRIALILLAGPVAILMNMVRVTVLGLLTLFDPNLAAGDAHTLIGTILLVPSLGLFLGVVWVLNRIVGTGNPASEGKAA
ncbi:MAG: archaeosortase/exosortase family protein [Phycisphaerales bacterium]|nr:archaeosortase/exosortase family protein [Phycisphaerales bacterium]